MICRFKDCGHFVKLSTKDFRSFVQKNTTVSGKLIEPVEIIQAGFLSLSDTSEADSFPWVFSTYDMDRFDERVDQKGWELERFLDNPVVLWAHCHSIPAIGIVSDLSAQEALCGLIRFNSKDFDEFGWGIGERVKAGVLRAASVGMLVKEVEWIDKRKNPEETCDLIIRRQELLELSICNVPANPFALQGNEKQSVLDEERIGAPTVRSAENGHWPFLAM